MILEFQIQFQQLRVSSDCLSCCQTFCSAFSSEMSHLFFLIFCATVDNCNIWKLTGRFLFSPKNSFLPEFGQRRNKMTSKSEFLDFFKKFFISFSWKWCKMKINIVIDTSLLFSYLAKFCFSTYGPKYCW